VSDNLEAQVAYWQQKVNADPAMIDQVIRAMLLARQTQAKVEAAAKADAIYDANVGDKMKVEIQYFKNQHKTAEAHVKELQEKVVFLTAVLWREKPGYHCGDPCIFCGIVHDDLAVGECPGTNVQNEVRL